MEWLRFNRPQYSILTDPLGKRPPRPRRAPPLNRRDDWNWQSWQVDDEDASPVGQTARVDPASVRFDAQPAEGKAQACPGAIGASLFKRAEQLVDRRVRKTATLVLDLDEHALSVGADAQRDGAMRARELERVLQQVSDHCGESLLIGFDRHF